ncbi:hypothetical protein B0H14DRAFT_2592432 [Mycena olivaceomarginata]|nr:hypothetical protein B0H14DRAFT_2592432 [Mycena olivaceomarginata]
MPWADDVSGNRSKQYNAHMNMYLANLNLPHKLLAQEYLVRFCATSQHALSLEQFEALVGDCKQEDWTATYDCKLQEEILFRIGVHLLPADNPQQAETTSTSGSSATFWCREDDSGGSASHRETDEGYHALFSPGRTRTPEETIAKIKEQIRAACLGVATAVEQLQTDSGVKDKIAVRWMELLLEKSRAVQKERVYNRDTRNPRLNDPKIKGEPRAEIKQAILDAIQEELYTWVIMQPAERYEKLDQETPFEECANTVVGDNPDLRPGDHYNVLLRLRGLDSHRDSPCEILHTILLGEDKYVWHETTKAWNDEQDDKLCSPELFELWKANGVLGALLWFPEIKDMDQYLADLEMAINNVLDRSTNFMFSPTFHQLSADSGPQYSSQPKFLSVGIRFFAFAVFYQTIKHRVLILQPLWQI